MKYLVSLIFAIIFSLASCEIYEPDMELPLEQRAPLDPYLVPSPLLVSRPPRTYYMQVVAVPTRDNMVPDVVTYLRS
ncbi:hypothetical protein JTB14_027237 [Gonioctena quinquepunctata]|nr:hypothetical protein JTB14_027237 [Gonioctena quinquepunctata]